MNPHAIFAVIALQIVIFQFLAPTWVRAMLGFRLGLRDLPPAAEAAVAAHDRRAALVWRTAGALLLLAALGLTFLPGMTYPQRKIGLTFVSLASSAGLLLQMLLERGVLRSIASLVPPPAVRSASLEPRRLDHYYAASLESVPILAFAATVAFTILAVRAKLPGLPATFAASGDSATLWIAPLAQLVFAIGGALAARGALLGQPLLSQQSRASLGDPATAIQLEEALRRVKLRGLIAVRIAIALMFALMQVRRVYAPLDHGNWMAVGVWGVVAAILGLFAGLMLRLAGLRKGAAS